MRAECVEVETGLSYLRRMVQGPLDIVNRELVRREVGVRADRSTLIEELPGILADGPRPAGVGRLSQQLEPTDVDPELAAELDAILGGGVIGEVTALDDDALVGAPAPARGLRAAGVGAPPRLLRSDRRPPGRAHPPLPHGRGHGRRPADLSRRPVRLRACPGRRSGCETPALTRLVPRTVPGTPVGRGTSGPRRVHPRAAAGGAAVAAQAVRAVGHLEPVPEPDRAGPAPPSAEILQQIARALSISVETLYVRAGILEPAPEPSSVIDEIRRDPHLDDDQKRALDPHLPVVPGRARAMPAIRPTPTRSSGAA